MASIFQSPTSHGNFPTATSYRSETCRWESQVLHPKSQWKMRWELIPGNLALKPKPHVLRVSWRSPGTCSAWASKLQLSKLSVYLSFLSLKQSLPQNDSELDLPPVSSFRESPPHLPGCLPKAAMIVIFVKQIQFNISCFMWFSTVNSAQVMVHERKKLKSRQRMWLYLHNEGIASDPGSGGTEGGTRCVVLGEAEASPLSRSHCRCGGFSGSFRSPSRESTKAHQRGPRSFQRIL